MDATKRQRVKNLRMLAKDFEMRYQCGKENEGRGIRTAKRKLEGAKKMCRVS